MKAANGKTYDESIVHIATGLVTDTEKEGLRKKYALSENETIISEKYPSLGLRKLTPSMHRRITGGALLLFKAMFAKGATMEELEQAGRYFCVCADAFKHKLNFLKAREDLLIADLAIKYLHDYKAM